MLVSDRKRFIFVHNPKTGGSSVREALQQYDDRNGLYWDHEDSAILGRIIDKAHIPLPDFNTFSDGALLEDYFVFGFVRNPYDRTYSAFKEKKKQWQLADDTSFSEFVQTELNQTNIRYDWNLIHFCPQHHFFYSNGKCRADYIGRFESLTRDFAHCINLIGFDEPVDLPYLNSSNTGQSGDRSEACDPRSLQHYDKESLRIVNQLYDRDFVYFGYEKYFPESDTDIRYFENDHADNVHRSLGFIKGAEQFYAARLQLYLQDAEDLKSLRESFESQRQDFDSMRQDFESQRQELEALRQEYAVLERINEEVVGSNSWRATAPLRHLGAIIRRSFGAGG